MNNLVLDKIYEIQTLTLKLRRKFPKMYVNFTDGKSVLLDCFNVENSYIWTVELSDSLDEIKENIKKYFRRHGMYVSDNRSGTSLIIEWKA